MSMVDSEDDVEIITIDDPISKTVSSLVHDDDEDDVMDISTGDFVGPSSSWAAKQQPTRLNEMDKQLQEKNIHLSYIINPQMPPPIWNAWGIDDPDSEAVDTVLYLLLKCILTILGMGSTSFEE
jgi:hypothetical protein